MSLEYLKLIYHAEVLVSPLAKKSCGGQVSRSLDAIPKEASSHHHERISCSGPWGAQNLRLSLLLYSLPHKTCVLL